MSDIWKYYDKSSANEAQCQICKRKLARKDGSTRGMWKHLEAKHQQDFQQLKGTLNDGENGEEQRSLEVGDILGANVTIHWTDTNWNRQDMVLAAFPMDEFRHSGDVLAEKIATCLTEKGISMEKLVCCVRDDARNMQCAIRRMEKDRFAYDEEIFSKANWALIEEDVQEFAKRMDNENEFQLEEAGTSSLCDIDDLADDCDERSDDSIKFDIWKPKSPASVSLPSAISTTSRIQVQLAAFKVDARPLLDTDIFSWWKQNGAQFPALDKIARVVHSIPATSVSSERLFSKAGLIYGNKLRNRYFV
ncbi:hypothetical protein GPALN_004541 [Globodera pallida]|nr:hypothetical protein GPALN_004541 [Globodera pallida]